jgi:phosphopantothenoylcysteine decarboxylase/phosphopantothenate--cysteine ligase
MGKAAHGIADDLLSSAFLACDAPVLLAPSMNARMWENPATVRNMEILTERGVRLAGPVKGELACGTVGCGRLMEPGDILDICLEILEMGS